MSDQGRLGVSPSGPGSHELSRQEASSPSGFRSLTQAEQEDLYVIAVMLSHAADKIDEWDYRLLGEAHERAIIAVANIKAKRGGRRPFAKGIHP